MNEYSKQPRSLRYKLLNKHALKTAPKRQIGNTAVAIIAGTTQINQSNNTLRDNIYWGYTNKNNISHTYENIYIYIYFFLLCKAKLFSRPMYAHSHHKTEKHDNCLQPSTYKSTLRRILTRVPACWPGEVLVVMRRYGHGQPPLEEDCQWLEFCKFE